MAKKLAKKKRVSKFPHQPRRTELKLTRKPQMWLAVA